MRKRVVYLLLVAMMVMVVALGACGTTAVEEEPPVVEPPVVEPPPPGPTPAAQPTGLSIENVLLCSDVRAQDDYDLQIDSTYVRGQPVYVYFEFYGAMSTKRDSDYETHLQIAELTLFDPEGQEVAAKVNWEAIRETSPRIISSGALWLLFEAPLLGPVGEYSAEVKVKDMTSGDTAKTTASFIVKEGPLAVEHLRLCSEITSFRDYTVQPDSTYRLGDRVWIYFEVLGISLGGSTEQPEMWVNISHLKLYDPNGRLIINVADILTQQLPYEPLMGLLNLQLWLDTGEDWTLGQYRAEMTVEDGWTGEAVTESFDFRLK